MQPGTRPGRRPRLTQLRGPRFAPDFETKHTAGSRSANTARGQRHRARRDDLERGPPGLPSRRHSPDQQDRARAEGRNVLTARTKNARSITGSGTRRSRATPPSPRPPAALERRGRGRIARHRPASTAPAALNEFAMPRRRTRRALRPSNRRPRHRYEQAEGTRCDPGRSRPRPPSCRVARLHARMRLRQ
jgi:hypothetical protein